MKLVVELPDEADGRDMREVYARRLIDGANIRVQGFAARVVGTWDSTYDGLPEPGETTCPGK